MTATSKRLSVGGTADACTSSPSPETVQMIATGVPVLSTGIAGLDKILSGGLPAGRMYLVTGAPGTGKTTLSLQFALAGLAAGERVLYLTLSQSREELEMIARSHGFEIDGLTIADLTDAAGLLGSGGDHTVFYPGEVDLTELIDRVREEVERVDPQRLIIDSATEFRLVAGEELRFRRHILALRQFLVTRGCTTLVIDPDAGNQTDSFAIHSLVYGTLLLEQHPPNYGDVYRRLQIMKMRGVSISGGFHDFTIAPGGLQVYPRLTMGDASARYERGVVSSGVTALDEMLGGGLERGTACLLLGLAGTGKSTISTLFCLSAAKSGHRAAIYTFDETRETVLIRTKGMSMDLEPWIDRGLLTVEQLSAAEVSSGAFAERVRRDVEDNGVSVVVLDSLTGYLEAYPPARRAATQIHDLVSYLSHCGALTIMTVPQHGLLNSTITSELEVSYISDTVVVLRHFEEDGEMGKALAVVKRRRGGHRGDMRRYRLTSQGIEFPDDRPLPPGILHAVPGVGMR